jgi:hypothetical protein
VGLQPLTCWDWGFESCRGNGCLFVVSVVCCRVEVSATGLSLVPRRNTDCGVSECDREASITRRPWPTGGCCAMGEKNNSLTIKKNITPQLTQFGFSGHQYTRSSSSEIMFRAILPNERFMQRQTVIWVSQFRWRVGENRNAYRALVRKTEGNRPTGRQHFLVGPPPYLRVTQIPQTSWCYIISVSDGPKAGAVEMQGRKSDQPCKNAELSGIPSNRCENMLIHQKSWLINLPERRTQRGDMFSKKSSTDVYDNFQIRHSGRTLGHFATHWANLHSG